MKPDGFRKWHLPSVETGLTKHYPGKGWAVSNAITNQSQKHQKPNSNTYKVQGGGPEE